MSGELQSVLVVASPWPGPRTMTVGLEVMRAIAGAEPTTVCDLDGLGAQLLDADSPQVTQFVEAAKSADLLVVVSPTFRGTYTGLLKLFLERFDAGSLLGVPTVAVMLGGSREHSLAVEVFLKPLLAELGAMCLGPGIFVADSDASWLDREAGKLDSIATLLTSRRT